MTPTIGSLFSGYGGLDLAVEQTIGARTVWHCEIEAAPSRVLAARWPGVPNLGDITAVDWSTVAPVDILTGGFPCQDVSHAGRRAGLGPGTRTGLWARMADAIDHLRPALVIAENVRGLLSVEAHSDVEPCPWCLGDDEGGGEPPLRALGAVLADLADLRYDAQWYGLRAADVGAPHGRFRVFVAAWPSDSGRERLAWTEPAAPGRPEATDDARRHRESAADADGVGPVRGRGARGRWGGSADDSRVAPDAGRDARSQDDTDRTAPPGRRGDLVPDAARDGRDEGRPAPAGLVRGPDAALGGHAAPDADGERAGRDRRAVPGEARVGGRPDFDVHAARAARGTDWGAYGPAIHRWERVLGRPASAPTEPGSKGQPRLSPRFVEWMMGLPAGWVTDVPGISRNDQLKMLGNGVVPQQAADALRTLLRVSEAAA